MLARKAQRQTELFRYRSVNRNCRKDAHWRARCKAAERLRAKLHPVPLFSFLVGCEPINLIEVIIWPHVARIALAHWRLQRPEMDAVIFGAGDKHHTFETRRGASYGSDRVHQHVAIWARVGREVRCASGSSLECRVEAVCDVRQLSQLEFRIFGVK